MGRKKSETPNYMARTFFCVLHNKALLNMGIEPNWDNLEELKANLNECFNMVSENYKYTICKSEQGVYHIHLVITLSKPIRATALSKKLGNAHIETMRGTKEQAEDYIEKRGKFEEKGEIILDRQGSIDKIENNQGYRTDWANFDKIALQDDFDLNDYILKNQITGKKEKDCINRYTRLMQTKAQAFRKLEVVYVEGETGQGKTKGVYDRHNAKDIFRISQDNTNSFKFDGYQGEKILLLDELRPNQIATSYLFQILDGYPMRVNVKGGYMWAQWEKIYITTCYSLDNWYKVDKSKPYFDTEEKVENVEKLRAQFLRRISTRYKAENFEWVPIPKNIPLSSSNSNITQASDEKQEEFMQISLDDIPDILK